MFGKELGAAITRAREHKSLTQGDLAALIGVKQAAVSQYETGVRALTVEKLSAIEDALEVSFGSVGINADAAYALGQASDELRAIGVLAADLSARAFAAADRVALPRVVPSPLEVEAAGRSARAKPKPKAKPKARKAV